MTIAAGSLIVQAMSEDTYPAFTWDSAGIIIIINTRILDSRAFQRVTGHAPPTRPIDAKTWELVGLPFHHLQREYFGFQRDFEQATSIKLTNKAG